MIRLNDEQQQVVAAPFDTHVKILAGPGTGKSTTIQYRIARAIQNEGFEPSRVLVIMFNKKPQVEFEQKLSRLLPDQMPVIRTYNALGYRVCQSLEKLGKIERYEFSISEVEQNNLMKQALINVSEPKYVKHAEDFYSFVNFAKSSTRDIYEIYTPYKPDDPGGFFVAGFKEYERLRHLRKVRFFSDQIYDPVQHFLKHPEDATIFNDKLDLVFVDEFQDINDISMKLLEFLSSKNTMFNIIGDDDQTINEWRGSQPSYLISDFEKKHKPCLTYRLQETHRFGHFLSLAAYNVICQNKQRADKFSYSSHSTPTTNLALYTELEGGRTTSRVVRELLKTHSMNDIAILVRVFSSTPAIELDLMASGIPYRIQGAPSIDTNPLIISLIRVLKLHHFANTNPQSINSALISAALKMPRIMIKNDVLEPIYLKIANIVHSQPQTEWEAQILGLIPENLHQFSAKKFRESLERLICLLNASIDTRPSQLLTDFISNEPVFDEIRKQLEPEDALQNISIIESFSQFVTEFSTSESAYRGFENLFNQSQSYDAENCILITSIHQSKGCDWPIVIMPALAQGTFPYEYQNHINTESERRLFFVGMTRAKSLLVMIAPYDPSLFGSQPTGKLKVGTASQFLKEADLLNANIITAKILGKYPKALPTMDKKKEYNKYLQKIAMEFRVS